jgi:hypothetical protein
VRRALCISGSASAASLHSVTLSGTARAFLNCSSNPINQFVLRRFIANAEMATLVPNASQLASKTAIYFPQWHISSRKLL